MPFFTQFVIECLEAKTRAFEFVDALPNVLKNVFVFVCEEVGNTFDASDQMLPFSFVIFLQFFEEFACIILSIDAKCDYAPTLTNVQRSESNVNFSFHLYVKSGGFEFVEV